MEKKRVGNNVSQFRKKAGYLYKSLLYVFFLFFFNGGSISQAMADQTQQQVSGQIIDATTKETLPGVNILVKGTTIGTVSNMDGEYNLEVPDSESILVFSFVGYLTQEIRVGNQGIINVELVADQAQLDEVVVIGYGSQKKSDLTGAVTRVDAETFKNLPITNVSEMLTGTVAGFYGNQSTSAAGGSSLEVRGPTSLSAGTTPLIVLDGVIYQGNLADINPNDIETIDILKDASSAAVFGSKAASGVLLVTTKKGKNGKPTINFTTKIGVNQITNDKFGPLDAKGYENFRRDFFRTQGTNLPDWYWNHPDDLPGGVSVDQWRNASSNPHPDNTLAYLGRLNFFPTEVEQYLAGQTTNWFDQVYHSGLRQEYDLSIGGGSDRFSYYWSVGHVNNEGIIRGDEFSAIRTRLNVDFKVNDWLNIGTNAQISLRDDSSVPAEINDIQSMGPYSKIFEEDGNLAWYPNGYYHTNPLIDYYEQERINKTTSIFASMYADVNLPYGFNYRLSFQPRFEFQKDYNFWGDETIVGVRDHLGGYGTREDYSLNAWMVDNIITWKKEVGIHSFDVTLLYNAEQTKTYLSLSENETFRPNQSLIYHGLQFGAKPATGNDDTESGGNALMARLNYSLFGKYLFTTSIRRDGYSAFGQENNKATFPAAAFAWNISDEGFFPQNKLIDRVKLRLSWGINGNRDIGIYSALAQIGTSLYYDGSNVQMGLFNSSLANPGLRWEKTEAYNVGLDIGLLENRIDLSAEFYDMTTTDLLMNRQLPEITGFSNITANLGELQNRGMDLTLNTVNFSQPDFTWKSSFVFSMNRNKIIKLFGDYEEVEINGEIVQREVADYTNYWFPGEAIDAVWDYDVIGVWQLDEAAQAAEFNMRPGDYKAVDVDANNTYEALVDKKFIGHTRPRHRLGLRNDFMFLKDFTASIFVRADLGHLGIFPYAIHESSEYDRRGIWNIPYWTPTNGNNEYARTSEVHGAFGGGLRIFKPRSFVRIQDVSLSYNLPVALVQRLQIANMRIFASTRNLYTFTNWPGYDPESQYDPEENAYSPMPKTYTLGVNLSF